MLDHHVHTAIDDGKLSISETIEQAVVQGVDSLAIVAHDDVKYHEQSVTGCRSRGIDCFAVSELTARDGHYLLFLPDFRAAGDTDFNERLDRIRLARRNRIEQLVRETAANPMQIDIPVVGTVDLVVHWDDFVNGEGVASYMTGNLARALAAQTNGAITRDAAYGLLHKHLYAAGYDAEPSYRAALFYLDELVVWKKKFDGLLIEAHPKSFDLAMAKAKLGRGLDGFELSPKNRVDTNLTILQAAESEGFLVSAGTDNHMWDSQVLGFTRAQPDIYPFFDEHSALAALDARLNKRY